MNASSFLIRALLALSLYLGIVPSIANAQQTADIIRGRVTAPDGQPVQGVQVRALSYIGGIEKTTRTDKNGRYSIVYPNGEGDYWMQFNEIGFQGQRFELKRRADEDVLIGDAKLSRTQDLQAVNVTASGTHLTIPRNDNYQDISGGDKSITTGFVTVNPNAIGDLVAQAAALPGVQLIPGVDGAPDRFSIFGLAGDQNNATLNGLQQGLNRLPRDANLSLQLRTGYDITTGGAAGATIAVNTVSGTNQIVRPISLLLNAPQAQWNDPAGRASQYGSISIGGRDTGPWVMDKDFYNVSFQLNYTTRDLSSLGASSASVYQSAGLARDSVNRLIGILNALHVPTSAKAVGSNTDQNFATAVGTFDWASKSPSSGNAVTVAFNGTFESDGPQAVSPLATSAALSDSKSGSGGVLLRHTNFFSSGMLTESVLSVSGSGLTTTPFLGLPSGSVIVSSVLDNSSIAVQSLTFGGAAQARRNGNYSAGARNVLSRISENNKHRIKLLSEVRADAASLVPSQNLFGHYTYQSLADLEANRPSSYTRRIADARTHSASLEAALGLGDSYRVTRDWQLQYGLRADAVQFLDRPVANASLVASLNADNTSVPNRVYLSPRFGFSKTFQDDHPIILSSGYFTVTEASTLTGGIGVFQNVRGADLISTALANTGTIASSTVVQCVGSATPPADWSAFGVDVNDAPTTCANGNTDGFASRATSATFLAKNFVEPRSLRSTLNWNTQRWRSYRVAVNATSSINFNQPDYVDANLQPLRQLALSDEAGRPVYVAASDINAASGIAALNGSRTAQGLGVVSELESRLRSVTSQLGLGVARMAYYHRYFLWSVQYAYVHTRQQFRDASSLDENPGSIRSSISSQPQHDLSLELRWLLGTRLNVVLYARARSGERFTPTVAGDVNGDGVATNDRAFVFDPSRVTDPALAASMNSLLADGSASTRSCLRRQLNTIAGRNSCTGPWSVGSSQLQFILNSVKFGLPQRATLSFTISNPVGAADLLLHGVNGAHGWGETPAIDQSLLYVRGFDATAAKFSYLVNSRFGASTQATVASRTPVVLTARLSVAVAPRREWQDLHQALERGRSRVGAKMTESATRQYGVPGGALFSNDPMAFLLNYSEYAHLSRTQADSVARVKRRYNRLVDSLWTPFAKELALLPNDYDKGANERKLVAIQSAAIEFMIRNVPAIRRMLTAGQIKAISPNILQYGLDETYWRQRKQGLSSTFGLYAPP